MITFPTDYDAAERFVLAAADGHHAAAVRIIHTAMTGGAFGPLSVMFALSALVVRLARMVGGDAWHGALRTALAELRREADEAAS